MFIIHIEYLVGLTEIEHYLQAHRDFLELHYQTGQLLASGPLIPRTGGIMIAMGRDRDQIEALCQADPLTQAGVARYEIHQFSPTKHHSCLDALLSKAVNTDF